MGESKSSDNGSIRNRILAASAKMMQRVPLVFAGCDVELERLRIGERTGIFDAATENEKLDTTKAIVLTLIQQTFEPGTKNRVFEDGDLEVLLNDPSGGFVDTAMPHVNKMLGVESEEEMGNGSAVSTKTQIESSSSTQLTA